MVAEHCMKERADPAKGPPRTLDYDVDAWQQELETEHGILGLPQVSRLLAFIVPRARPLLEA